MAQIGAFNVFHGHVRRTILALVEIDDLHHVGVLELGGSLRLAAEAAQECGVLAKFAGDEFERPLTAQQNVFGKVDRAHAAAAELALDAVLAANDRARLQLARLDEQRAVGGAVRVVARIGRFAQRTRLHRPVASF